MNSRDAPKASPVWRWAPLSITIHFVLPLLLALLSWLGGSSTVGTVVVLFHVLFGALMLITLRWWRPHFEDIILLLILNHMTTFISGSLLLWVINL